MVVGQVQSELPVDLGFVGGVGLTEHGQQSAGPAGVQGPPFVLHTGIAWEHLPQGLGFGSGMTC
ncbi:hypothetical protein [Streptomyces iranensis]|uniref:hypothetical protein n=1 Tax=Streptomyces iranensis TaxID=576784 RepID=UPI0039B733CA